PDPTNRDLSHFPGRSDICNRSAKPLHVCGGQYLSDHGGYQCHQRCSVAEFSLCPTSDPLHSNNDGRGGSAGTLSVHLQRNCWNDLVRHSVWHWSTDVEPERALSNSDKEICNRPTNEVSLWSGWCLEQHLWVADCSERESHKPHGFPNPD